MQNNNYGKFFTIPQSAEDHDILLAVDRKTRYEVNSIYGCSIEYDWQCNTIANAMVETIIRQLSTYLKSDPRGGIGINFYDLFSSQVTVKVNPHAEKEGNINIMFFTGPVAIDTEKLFATNNERRSMDIDFELNDSEESAFHEALDKNARYTLTINNGLVFVKGGKFIVTGICYVFLKNLLVELSMRLKAILDANEDCGEVLLSVNFNDNIEIHATVDEDREGIIFSLRPGMNAKLLIKSDESTEDTMGDDE